jgi:serine protease Do
MKNSLQRSLSAAALSAALFVAPIAGAAPGAMDIARQLNEAFVSVSEEASKSVVVIEVSGKVSRTTGGDSRFFDMMPPELRERLDEFFNERRQQQSPRRQQESPTPRERLVPQGQGSGVIIREDGYILTNNHVVEEGDLIKVRLVDGKEYTATVQGRDPESDIAVLKIDATGLKTAKLGNSDKTRVGEYAIAIGAPFALNYSVTIGHVSAKGRQVFSSQIMMDQDFIQTDASINPGNSGGPLVNLDGEVIGINTLIRGINTGIGFAVPINLARQVAETLIDQGKFTRAWLGIGIATLSETPQYRDTTKGVKEGVVVANILPEGPAAKSKLEPGDVITSVDGKPVKTSQELKNEIRLKKIGSDVSVDVVRDGRKMKFVVNPGEFPSGDVPLLARSSKEAGDDLSEFGMKVQTLTPDLAEEYGVKAGSGVVVTEVVADSLAQDAGILPGDVISKVNSTEVKNVREFREAMKQADVKRGVRLSVASEAGRRLTILKDGE